MLEIPKIQAFSEHLMSRMISLNQEYKEKYT